MQIQNIDENLSMNISDTSGVSLQVSDVDNSLEMNIDTNKDVINLNIIDEEGNITMEVETGEQGYFYVDDMGMNVPYTCREKLGDFLS